MIGSEHPQRTTVDELDAAVGGRLRRRRETLGWSQQKVADMLEQRFGIAWHQTTVGKTETGERPLKLSEALALAYTLFLSTTMDELLTDSPEGWRESTLVEGAESELRLLDEYVDARRRELRAQRGEKSDG